MGLDAQFEQGVNWTVKNLRFDIDADIQLFESSIRLVGGLLSAHHACGDKRLLDLAQDLAERLSPAFTKSPTGMPYRFVNLRTGAVRDPVSNPAEVGSYLPEWGTLSRLTGDKRFYDLPKAATKAMFDRRSAIDLLADTINVETGQWMSRRATIGPLADFLLRVPVGRLAAVRRRGLQALVRRLHRRHPQISAGLVPGPAVVRPRRLRDRPEDGHAADRAGRLLRRAPGAGRGDARGPRLHPVVGGGAGSLRHHPRRLRLRELQGRPAPSNALRPELADAAFNLWLLDQDPLWRRIGRTHFLNMKGLNKTRYGFSGVRNLLLRPMILDDSCPGYWWSEQMKYYYLLFSDTPRFDYKTNYLSTEGNVLLGFRKV